MKNTLLALIVALAASLFAVIPQSVRADSVWPEQVSKESGLHYVIYTVRRGDKLEHIARNHSSDKYQIDVTGIVELNYIQNPHRILIGQKLRLPMHYEKEAQAVVPATVQAAVEAAVAPKDAAIVNTRRGLFAISGGAVVIILLLHMLYMSNMRKIETSRRKPDSAENPEPEKFLTYPDEITALLRKCTGRDVAAILESELVDVPRNPGSAVMNKKKLVNLKDLMHNNPELYDMTLESWSEHLAVKMNRVAPASAESA